MSDKAEAVGVEAAGDGAQRAPGRPSDAVAEKAARLTRDFTARAEHEGLVEVAYTVTESPFGPLLIAGTEVGLIAVGLPDLPFDPLLERLAAQVSPRVLEIPTRLEPVRRRLDAYFEGELIDFDLPLDLRLSRGFMRTALGVVADIPYGETLSYAEVAAAAGSPRAFRAAGSACATNPVPIVVPCHRVLASGGGLGGYGGGLAMKRALLDMEQKQAPLPRH